MNNSKIICPKCALININIFGFGRSHLDLRQNSFIRTPIALLMCASNLVNLPIRGSKILMRSLFASFIHD